MLNYLITSKRSPLKSNLKVQPIYKQNVFKYNDKQTLRDDESMHKQTSVCTSVAD